MKKPLAHFRYMTRKTVAKLDGAKMIMRVDTPRTCQFWMVLPATGDDDAVCVLISKVKRYERYYEIARIQSIYADRITA